MDPLSSSTRLFCDFKLTLFSYVRPTVLCKIVGVYQIGVHNKVTGKRSMEQVAVMQNIFYKRRITRIFDLKGSLRGRYAAHKEEVSPDTPSRNKKRSNASKRTDDKLGNPGDGEIDGNTTKSVSEVGPPTLLDGDFLEFTMGRPMPLTDRAKALFQMSILNVSFKRCKVFHSVSPTHLLCHRTQNKLGYTIFVHCQRARLFNFNRS